MQDLLKHLFIDFVQMQEFEEHPLILTRGEGVRVWDQEGTEYLDAISGVFVVNVGHGNRRVIEAVVDQIQRLAFGAPTLATTDRALELVERLAKVTPDDMRTFKFHSGGSEAVEAAIKMARQYHRQTGSPGKYKVVSRYRSYHGATMGALSATGWLPFKRPFEPLLPGFIHVPPPDGSRCKLNSNCPPCQLSCVDLIEEVISREGADTVAAVIVEPYMVMAGGIPSPPDYLRTLWETCERNNVLLIYDEIISAFGRLGHWFGADLYGVWPDLMCVGKGITSGYAPLSAVIVSDRVAGAFRGRSDENRHFMSGHTYGGNPLACAAAVAVMDEIEERGLLENTSKVGEHLLNQLTSIGKEQSIVREVRGLGLLAFVETMEPHFALQVSKAARDLGVLTLPSPEGIVRLGPPLISSIRDVDEIVVRMEAAMKKVTKGI